jgi:hypothetical protein
MAPETESASTNKLVNTVPLKGANRPKLIKMVVSHGRLNFRWKKKQKQYSRGHVRWLLGTSQRRELISCKGEGVQMNYR